MNDHKKILLLARNILLAVTAAMFGIYLIYEFFVFRIVIRTLEDNGWLNSLAFGLALMVTMLIVFGAGALIFQFEAGKDNVLQILKAPNYFIIAAIWILITVAQTDLVWIVYAVGINDFGGVFKLIFIAIEAQTMWLLRLALVAGVILARHLDKTTRRVGSEGRKR